jgi:cytochrome c oxidase cbb3-type subunit 3
MPPGAALNESCNDPRGSGGTGKRNQVRIFGSSSRSTAATLSTCAVVASFLTSCDRERRDLRADPPVAAALDNVALMPGGRLGAAPEIDRALGKPFENNAFNRSEGKRLYAWFGCRQCHGDGEGGKGPPFLDGWWIYGPDPVSIFASIRDGRPHGMPAFRDRLVTEQIWQITGYVRSIGAYAANTAAPSRSDEPFKRPAENRAPANLAPLEPPSR